MQRRLTAATIGAAACAHLRLALLALLPVGLSGVGARLCRHAARRRIAPSTIWRSTSASDRSGITGLSGRMVYEFNGSPCEGYTVKFRFVTQIDTGENGAAHRPADDDLRGRATARPSPS